MLFHAAAAAARLINPVRGERFLAAALAMLAGLRRCRRDPLVTQLLVEQHAALVSLGRLEEADTVYVAIEARITDAIELVTAADVQIISLTRRGRPYEAVTLGIDLLSRARLFPAVGRRHAGRDRARPGTALRLGRRRRPAR